MVSKNFSLSGVISLCTSLNLDTSGNKEQLIHQIFSFLSDLKLFMENESSLFHDADDISLQTEFVTGAKPTAVFTTESEIYSKDTFFYLKNYWAECEHLRD